jgi:membrane protease subunit (stomatin/prohibitin family)
MGWVEKLRGELIDIVEWVDDSRRTLVWRFPRHQNQIKQGARLIVRPGQVAIFVDRGKLADVFPPGFYKLETANLPVLSTLQGWTHGFESPFKAEVYFVATRQITDLKWGTPNPVMMRDADFGPVRVRAFGSYTLKASDPRALLTELVGADSRFESEEISVLLRSIVANCFADMVASSGISVLDLASNYRDLSEKLRELVVERVDNEYGLDVPQLYIVNISVPEEVEKALDTRSSMGIIGDMATFHQYQLGTAMPLAAENPAGGLAGAGVGLGLGMAMAGPLTRTLVATGADPAGAAPPPLPASGSVWHVVESGRPSGPFNVVELAEMVISGRISVASLMWAPGLAAWTPAGSLPQLLHLFPQTPPPPPPEA